MPPEELDAYIPPDATNGETGVERTRAAVEFGRGRFLPLFVEEAKPRLVGTCVPIQIAGRHFLLTAGHCMGNLRLDALVTLSGEPPRTVKVEPVRAQHQWNDESDIDLGFIEVTSACAQGLMALDCLFTGPPRFHVATSDEVLAGDLLPFCVMGFPGELQTTAGNIELVGALTYLTAACGTEEHPASPFAPSPLSAQVIDLPQADPSKTVATWTPGRAKVPFPDLSGVSGGPVWRGHDGSGKTQLVGIHRATASTSEGARFYRCTLLGHYLRFMADALPDLRPNILALWPELGSPPWSTASDA